MVKEMQNFCVKVTMTAHETFEAWREGQHDDLVLATALAARMGERYLPHEQPPACPTVLRQADGVKVTRAELRPVLASGEYRANLLGEIQSPTELWRSGRGLYRS